MPNAQRAGNRNPPVRVGEAREVLQRALLFGDEAAIADAQREVDAALAAEGAERAVRRADSIRAALAQLPSGPGKPGERSAIDRAASGELLTSELYEIWQRDPDSLDLTPYEKQFVKVDVRRLRGLVVARRKGMNFHTLLNATRQAEDDSRASYGLAARADDQGALQDPDLQTWLQEYTRQLKEQQQR